MPSFPRFLSRVCGPFLPVLLVAAAATPGARAQFLPTGAATYAYDAPVNWVGGTINNVFSQVQTGAQNIAFLPVTTLTTGLTFNLGGTPRSLVLWGDGTDASLTLGGDVSVSGTSTAVTFGSALAGFRLNLVLGADRTFSVASGNTLTVNNVVSGANALTKTGTGQLTLAGANTYTGTTTVNAGTLLLSASGALASGNNVALNANAAGTVAQLTLGTGVSQAIGTLTFGGAGATTTSANNLTLNTGATLTLGGTVTYDATGNPLRTRIDGPGTLALGGDRTFNVGQSTADPDLSVFAPISGTGYTLTKTGGGRMDVYGPNSYTGGTVVQGGVLFLNVASPLLAASPVTVNAVGGGGASYVLGVINETIGALTFGGAGGATTSSNSIFINTGGTLTLGGTVTYDATGNPLAATISGGTVALGGDRTIHVGNSTTTTNELTISSPVAGSGRSLTKTGAGVLTLSGTNTFDGGTIVNGGTLALNASGALAAGSSIVINANAASTTALLSLGTGANLTVGALTFGGAGGTTTSTNSLTLSSTSTLTLGDTVTYDATGNPLGSLISGGTVALGGNRTFNIGNSGTVLSDFGIASIITGSGQSLIKTGAGRMLVNAANTYDGGTIINGGLFWVNGDNTLVATAPVTINDTEGAPAGLTVAASRVQTIGALTFGGAGATASSINNVTLNTGSALTLGGTVTYDATNNPLGTTISGSGSLVLGASRLFNIADSTGTTNEVSIVSPISGAGGLIKTGAGVLTLSGANTFSGGTIVNGGTLALSGSGRLASGSDVTINSTTAGAAAVLTLSANATQTIGALNFSGSGGAASNNNVTLNAGSTLTLGGTVTYDGTNNPLATTIAGPGTLALGGNRTFDIGNSSANPDFFISAPISGSGFSLTKAGAGRMDLSGANSYTGGTIVNGGLLFINASSPLQAASPVTVDASGGGTVTYTLGAVNQTVGVLTLGGASSTATSANNVTVNPGGTLTLSDTVTYLATNNPLGSTIGPTGSGSGTVALGGNRTFAVADSTSTTNELTISIPVSGSGQSLTKTGAGTLRLSGANTYDGGTILNGGGILLNASNTLASSGAVTINDTSGATSTLTLGAGFTQTIGTLTLGGAGASSTSTNNVTIGTGATLTLGGTVTYDATGNPAASRISGGTLALGGNRTFNVGDSSTAASSDLVVSSVITGSGQSLTKTGAGRLGFQGSNTYDGGTIINGGTVFLNNSNNLSSTGGVTINNTAGATSTFTLASNVTQTIGTLAFGGAGGSTTATNHVTLNTGATLTLGGTVSYQATGSLSQAQINGTGTLALGGNRTFDIADQASLPTELFISSGVSLSGPGFSLTKTGAGALGLEGASTYTGGTVVAAGVLAIWNPTGSATGTGPVTVQSGARIRGIGSVGGPTTLQAGAIAGTGGTGGTAGTLTFANGLTLNDGAVFNFQLGTTSDRLRLTGGTLTGAPTLGSLTINLTAGAGFGAGVYTLFDFSTGGVTTSSFDVGDFALGTTVSGYTYGLAMAGNTLQITATASAIPEPSTYAAIFGALSLVGAALYRRREKIAHARRPFAR